jgi:hypothetical protein
VKWNLMISIDCWAPIPKFHPRHSPTRNDLVGSFRKTIEVPCKGENKRLGGLKNKKIDLRGKKEKRKGTISPWPAP